jgi:bifunctional DNase/RNase
MPAAGTISLPLAAAAAAILALVAGGERTPRAPHGGGRVTLELAAVLPMPEGPAGLVVLRDRTSGTVLPLLVPDGDALDADARPGAAPEGLLGRALEALGARVLGVEIDAVEETSAGARVRLAQAGREIEVAARPSESLALALAAGATISTTKRLLAEAGLTPDELRHAHEALVAETKAPPLRL